MFHGQWMWLASSIVRIALLAVAFAATCIYYMLKEEEPKQYKPKPKKSGIIALLVQGYLYFCLSRLVWIILSWVDAWVSGIQCRKCKHYHRGCKWTRGHSIGRGPSKRTSGRSRVIWGLHSLAHSMTVKSKSASRLIQFDTDSHPLQIDNCAS